MIDRIINVLMIGNSFSVDAAHYTHQLSLGSDVEINVYVLYVGGCSLSQHLTFLQQGSAPYEYFVNGVSTGKYISLKDALKERRWDYVTLQQVSVFSGIKDTYYPFLPEIMNVVRDYQKDTTIVLHQTWPYENGFDNENFSHYGYDRRTMYKAICKAYNFVKKDMQINVVIRSGDVIENAIEEFGEHFHKDGFHLNDHGRYLAALTFVHTFNGNKLIKDLYVPEVEGFNETLCRDYDCFVYGILK